MRKGWWVILLISCLSAVLVYCSDQQMQGNAQNEPALKWLNHHDSVKYVGMQKCQQCHSDKHKTFIHTGMGMSFDSATREKSAAEFHEIHPVYDSTKNLYYLPFWSDSSLFIKEYRLEGKDTVHSRIERIQYIIGSGQHTNSHIFSLKGYLFQAPLTWYAQEGKWDLPPGFEGGQNSRFNRAIGFECMTCHNGLPEFDIKSTNHFYKVPNGIDCERCHGPGELHVKDKLAGNIVDISHDTDFTIVNPSKLSWQYQVDVCQRCHLQGNAVLKEGKHFNDFKPGMRLKEVFQVFMPKYKGAEDEFIMASHAQRFQMSRCFLKSNTEGHNVFTCISCHNPHVSVKVTGKSVFNSACESCHKQDTCSAPMAKRIELADNCVQCHMPANSPTDIPHVTVHDHYIRKPKKSASPSIQKKEFIGLYAVNDTDPSTLDRARAYLSYFEKFDRGNRSHLDSASRLLKAIGNPLPYRIHYLYLMGEFEGIANLKVQEPLDDAWTNYRIGRALHVLRKNDRALVFLKAAWDKQSQNLEFGNEYAATLLEHGDLALAKQLLESLLRKQPKQKMALNNLGYIYFIQGDVQEARSYYLRASQLDPDYLPALFNLADLYQSIKQYDKSRKVLLRAQKLDPRNQRINKLLELLSKTS